MIGEELCQKKIKCWQENYMMLTIFESKDRIIKKLFAETGKQIIVE